MRYWSPKWVTLTADVSGRRIVFVTPEITDHLPEEVKNALMVRREATMTGKCQCGAEYDWTQIKEGAVSAALMQHEDDCPAANEVFLALLKQHDIKMMGKMPS